MELIQFMEVLTVAVTMLMQLTGISPIVTMYQTGNTKNVPYVLFLLSGVAAQGMFHYGMMLENGTLIFINTVGMILQWSYVLIYIVLAESKGKPAAYFFLAASYMFGLYWYLYNIVLDEMEIAATIGGLSSLLCTLLCCMPIFEIIQNVKKKDTAGTPLIMLLGWVASSSCWLIYGLLLNDPNVYSPNIPALIIIFAKIAVVQYYNQQEKQKVE